MSQERLDVQAGNDLVAEYGLDNIADPQLARVIQVAASVFLSAKVTGENSSLLLPSPKLKEIVQKTFDWLGREPLSDSVVKNLLWGRSRDRGIIKRVGQAIVNGKRMNLYDPGAFFLLTLFWEVKKDLESADGKVKAIADETVVKALTTSLGEGHALLKFLAKKNGNSVTGDLIIRQAGDEDLSEQPSEPPWQRLEPEEVGPEQFEKLYWWFDSSFKRVESIDHLTLQGLRLKMKNCGYPLGENRDLGAFVDCVVEIGNRCLEQKGDEPYPPTDISVGQLLQLLFLTRDSWAKDPQTENLQQLRDKTLS